jgi:hypothetical protein
VETGANLGIWQPSWIEMGLKHLEFEEHRRTPVRILNLPFVELRVHSVVAAIKAITFEQS